jgi:hypothetical protein
MFCDAESKEIIYMSEIKVLRKMENRIRITTRIKHINCFFRVLFFYCLWFDFWSASIIIIVDDIRKEGRDICLI